jgi:tRNA-specific 2-thiouridylase
MATGHYARVDRHPATGRYRLRRGVDLRKDQSYFLYALTQQQLSSVLFPVGHLTKEETRRMAREYGLPVAEKQESQEICFVSGDYRGYLRQRAADGIRPGIIRDTSGAVRGRHPGIAYFTVGQRHGLGIHSPSALYVVALDAIRDEVIVGGGDDLLCSEVQVGQVNPIATDALDAPGRVLVKIRYAHAAVAAMLDPVTTGQCRVHFDEAQRAVAPGQAAVFYDLDDPEIVLGGGTILGSGPPVA